jgi:prepilin-type processing-associated H-X9-DG protein
LIWGSYGMNLSAALRGAKPRQMLFLEYRDWAAVVEAELRIRAPKQGWPYTNRNRAWRADTTKELLPLRHGKRVNVGFLDAHVESVSLNHVDYNPANPSPLWHPPRPVGWKPPAY